MEKSRENRDGAQSTQMSQEERETLRDGARRLTERDVPEESASHKAGRTSAQDGVYRPDANVDNQKHSGQKPGVDTRRETTPVGGAQVVHDKTSHKKNIDDEAKQAKSDRRSG